MTDTELNEMIVNNNVIMLTRFGSHLYGTDTPESDVDYKGIFIPHFSDLLLGRIKKSINFDSNKSNTKNSAGDIDCELYSIHHFFHLASKGETVAIDMLHANDENIIFSNDIWENIQKNRSMFYTAEMNAFVGYARKQAAKYGLRGSRLDAADELLKVLGYFTPDTKMSVLWSELPINEHCHYVETVGDILHYNFCGKIVQSTSKVKYVMEMVEKFIEQYGHRAKLAQQNEGVDWKAISHAVRAAYQLIEIYETGDLKFPLQSAEYLLQIKQGKLDFNIVIGHLERMMVGVENLSMKSTLPKKVDQEKVDEYLKYLLFEHYMIGEDL